MSNDLVKHHIVPTLITKRLRIRPVDSRDAQAIFKIRSDQDNMKFVEMKPYEDMDRAIRFVKHVESDMDEGKVFFWMLEHEGDHEIVGTICLWSFTKDRKKAELGYELIQSAQGKGYADEAVKAVVKFASRDLLMHWIDAITHEAHEASVSLLKRNGFAEIGYVLEHIPDAEDGPEMKLFRRRLSDSL